MPVKIERKFRSQAVWGWLKSLAVISVISVSPGLDGEFGEFRGLEINPCDFFLAINENFVKISDCEEYEFP